MRRSTQFAVFLLFSLGSALPCHAAKKIAWDKVTDCRYVEAKDNDGDSFRVHCPEKEFVVRLYFVDAPETNLRYAERTREQAEHFGVTLDEAMKAGVQAKEFVAKVLAKPFTLHTRWATAGGRAKESRVFALIEVDGKGLAEFLVAEGLARPKGTAVNLPSGEKSKAYIGRLEALEEVAQTKRVGAWGATSHKGETQTSK